MAATCAKLHCSSVTLSLSGYTSVVVLYRLPVTLAQRPRLFTGTSMTPSWVRG